MNKLLKAGNPVSAPSRCLQKMNDGGFEYVTWENSFAGARFIARKSYVEKQAHNKTCLKADERLEVQPGEVVKLGTNLTVDEVLFELDANNADEIQISEGMNKEKKSISRCELNVVEQVLYNPDFDCSVFWPKGNA